MNQLSNRVPLSRLELIQAYKSSNTPAKRIKISNQKFPSDFFKAKLNEKKMIASTQVVRKTSGTQQDLRCNIQKRVGLSIPRRQMSTALQKKDTDDELILGVISTARQMRRMIRKHSTDIKNDRNIRNQNSRVELPPISSKQGASLCF